MFEAEKQTSSVFQELPWHYLEVAHVLLTSAKECFSSVKEHMEVPLHPAAMRMPCRDEVVPCKILDCAPQHQIGMIACFCFESKRPNTSQVSWCTACCLASLCR